MLRARTERGLTRRKLLWTGGLSLAAIAATGCDLLNTEPASKDGATASRSAKKGTEAPGLAARVKDGTLPAVEERLPENPLVVEPVDRIGTYGGAMTTFLQGDSVTWLTKTIGYEFLVRWDAEWEGIVSNLAESHEFNDDGTEYTFRLRPGTKWSDGTAFTADDLVFAQNDILNNTDLYPSPPWLATAEKVDEVTVRFTFEEPEGLFLEEQAGPGGARLVSFPLHYLKEFHKKYNPDVEKLVEEENAADWMTLFFEKADLWQNLDLPRLHGWVPTVGFGSGERIKAVRNPYYWKVDPDGSQLPYIDEVIFESPQQGGVEAAVLKIANGDFDLVVEGPTTLNNKPVLARSREEGGYDFYRRLSSFTNTMVITFNLTHTDPVTREILRNKDFRIGLSHAIDRAEIIDVVYKGQGEPWQVAARPEAEEFHDLDAAKQFTEYDVELANEYLDKAGYSERDEDGTRLGPDGKPISVVVDLAEGVYLDHIDTLELVRTYWREVGIDLQIKSQSLSLFGERWTANEHEAMVQVGWSGVRDTILDPIVYFPVSGLSAIGVLWGQWNDTDGASGEEPPPAQKRQMELYDQINGTTDTEAQFELMREILAISKDEFYNIGINLYPEAYGIVANDLHNVPDAIWTAWLFQDPGPTNPEQYFFG